MVTSNKKVQNVPGIKYADAKTKYTEATIILFLHLSKTELIGKDDFTYALLKSVAWQS